MALHVKSFLQGFGAEVSGFDAQAGNSPVDIVALQDALASHSLLVLRECGRLSPKRQAQIIGRFGTVGAGRLPEDAVATDQLEQLLKDRVRSA